MPRTPIVLFALLALPLPASADLVLIEHQGPIDLKAFQCSTNPLPSFLKLYCYAALQRVFLVSLTYKDGPERWYRYCDVEPETFGRFEAETHKGKFYANTFRSSVKRGAYLCYFPGRSATEPDPRCDLTKR